MTLKVVFAGTPHFAIPSLEAVIKHHEVVAVYTKPDSASGRGLHLTYSPIKELVIEKYPHIPIIQPVNLKNEDSQRQLGEFHADVMVVIAYGLILPKALFELFKYGCINVHASLLPRWRGAAPIQRALLAGDMTSGITIMQINEGLDTGDILHGKSYHLRKNETAGSLHNNLANLGADSLIEALHKIETETVQPQAQDDQLATYAAKITKDEALIDWHQSAEIIERQIRAFNPWPIAHTFLAGKLLKIWKTEVVSLEPQKEVPGCILSANEKGIDVATGQGVLRILTVQISGGKPMEVSAFLNARKTLVAPKSTILGEKFC